MIPPRLSPITIDAHGGGRLIRDGARVVGYMKARGGLLEGKGGEVPRKSTSQAPPDRLAE